MDTKKEESDRKPVRQAPQEVVTIISRHTYSAVATGMIPIPIVDIAAVTAVQLDMLKMLSEHYNIDYSEVQGKSWIGALTASTMARVGASALKAIPIVGTVLGVTSMAILSGASTYAIGYVFVRHFEEGGTLLNFDIDAFVQLYDEKVNEGKEYAKDLIQRFKIEKKNEVNQSTTQQLQELIQMNKDELISDEEYVELRKKILNKFTSGI